MSYALLGFDDVNRALHNAALRLMGLFWIFYFWVIFTLFSAQLTSNLTVGKMPRRVETFHDLLQVCMYPFVCVCVNSKGLLE